MKGTIYIVCLIALISVMMVITPAAARTWYVDDDGGYDFTTIQDALNVASDGDTIFVYNGTYGAVEIFSLNTPNLTVIGEGADVVTYSRPGSNIRIGDQQPSPGCIVEGFTIVNSPTGLQVYSGSPNCIIRNCVFDGMTASYMYIYGDNLTFENCIFKEFTQPSVRIGGENSTVKNNLFVNCTSEYGPLYLKGASHSIVANNTFIDNAPTTSPSRILTLRGLSNCMVVNNTFVNNTRDAMQIQEANDNTITKNNITSNGGIIYLKDAGEGNKIYLNDFVDNTAGVTYYGTPPTTIYWNSTEQIEYVYDSYEGENYLGNYWSTDYTGTDGDSDGIGDTAYDIPGSATDRDYRPLMAGYENYPAPAGPEPTPTPTPPTPTPAVFDTGHGTYPSIRGTHTGTFTPNQTMVVNRMYTYPCVGTGGHTESVRFYRTGEVEVTKTWNGYHGDYHGIEFGADAPTLQAGTAYNYTIVTGSYPQIIHNETLTTPDGTINCTEFVDANEKRYTDWIPAIRLESGT